MIYMPFFSSFRDKHFSMQPLKLTMNMRDQTINNEIKHIKETMKLKYH